MRKYVFRIEWLVGALGLLVVGLVIYSALFQRAAARRHDRLLEMSDDLRARISLAQIWFEEAMAGDDTVAVDKDVYPAIDATLTIIEQMLRGGAEGADDITGFKRVEDRDTLRELEKQILFWRALSTQRWADPANSRAGSILDQKQDSVFKDILRLGGENRQAILRREEEERAHAANLLKGAVAALVALFAGIVALQGRTRKDFHERLADMEHVMQRQTAELTSQMRERKKTGDALLEREYRLRAVVDTAVDGIITFDEKGNIESVNPAMERIFGYPRTELVGGNVQKIFGLPEDYWLDTLMPSAQGGGTAFFGARRELQSTRKDGTAFPLELSIGQVNLSGGRMFTGIVRDITERKRAAEALRESAEQYRSLIETAGSVILGIKADHTVFEWNREAERVFGLRREEALDKDYFKITGQDAENELMGQSLQQVLGGKSTRNMEDQVKSRTGAASTLLWNLTRVLDGKGQPVGVIAIGQDITERKAAEDKFRVLFQFSSDAHLLFDETGVIDCNHAALQLLRCPDRSQLMGRHPAALSPETQPDGRPSSDAAAENDRLACERGYHRFEWIHRKMDGEEFPVEVTLTPVILNGKRILLSVWHDITEAKRVQEALREVAAASEAANRAKSDFLANMSHEIRTPMNGIIGLTELVMETEMTPAQREHLQMVQTSADYLLRVINDILDFSKIEAGKLELEPIPFNLHETLGDTVKTLAMRAEKKGIELACRIQPGVPLKLVGDPGRLNQIIINLIGNSIKFTEKGEVVMSVELTSAKDNGVELHFAIRDTGIGITPEAQKRLFAAFQQADNSMTRKYGGTGLGLAICAKLTTLMGGKIWVTSEPGQGSTFHFTARFERFEGETPTTIWKRTAMKGLPVLVVDDNETNRYILREILTHWEMKPAIFADGPGALLEMEKARKEGHPYLLAILDVNMPGMDGFTLAKHIRENPNLAPTTIMMLSSSGRASGTSHCLELGLDNFLVKPVKQSELFDAIQKALATTNWKPTVAPPPKPEPKPAEAAAPAGPAKVYKILLTEDNPVNQRVMLGILKKQNHLVTVANNGRQAVDALEKDKFDVVLMDVQMPEMDGFEATAAIRAKEDFTHEHQPIIAMTAHAMKGDRERCLEAGMDEYVTKPVKAAEVFAAIEKVINEFANRKAAAAVIAPSPPPPPAPAAGEPVYDRAELMETLDNSFELLGELLDLFDIETPGDLAALRQGIQAGDATRVNRAAHKLKGSVGNFAAKRAYTLAKQLEEMGRGGDLTFAPQALDDLEHAVKVMRGELQILLDQNGA
ncbi:MAG: PAS domain S-box protein [Verrucomicrobia bacterium]|nr:PAS domain S-box protein [Verrucomicrobiota bacterium]